MLFNTDLYSCSFRWSSHLYILNLKIRIYSSTKELAFFFFLICECLRLRRQRQGRQFDTEAVSENLGQINSCCQLSIRKILKGWLSVIMASCLKTAQNTISLFLCYYFFFLKESVYVFSALEIKVRRKGTIKHQEEWVRVDKDTEKPRMGWSFLPELS